MITDKLKLGEKYKVVYNDNDKSKAIGAYYKGEDEEFLFFNDGLFGSDYIVIGKKVVVSIYKISEGNK